MAGLIARMPRASACPLQITRSAGDRQSGVPSGLQLLAAGRLALRWRSFSRIAGSSLTDFFFGVVAVRAAAEGGFAAMSPAVVETSVSAGALAPSPRDRGRTSPRRGGFRRRCAATPLRPGGGRCPGRRTGSAERERQREFLRITVGRVVGNHPLAVHVPIGAAAGRLTGGVGDRRQVPRVAGLHALDERIERRGAEPIPIRRERLTGLSGFAPSRLRRRVRGGWRSQTVYPRRQDLVGPIVRAGEDRTRLPPDPVRPQCAGE